MPIKSQVWSQYKKLRSSEATTTLPQYFTQITWRTPKDEMVQALAGLDRYIYFRRRTQRGVEQQLVEMKRRRERTEMKRRRERAEKAADRNFIINNLINDGKFNEVIANVINNGETLTTRQTTAIWNGIQGSGRHSLKIVKKNGQTATIALNQNTLTYFSNLLIHGTDYEQIEEYGSDIMDTYEFNQIESIQIIKHKKPNKEMKNKAGGFFPLVNSSEIDLSDYQIYTSDQIEALTGRGAVKIEQCLIQALKGQVDEDLLNKVKLAFLGRTHINRKDLQKVANIIGRDIRVFYHDNKASDRVRNKLYKAIDTTQNDRAALKIAIHRAHYFKYEESKYSAYSIDNYEELKNEPDFHDLYMKNRRKKTRKISSLKLIKMLDNQNYFIKGDLSKIEDSINNPEVRDDIYLNRIEEEQRIVDSDKSPKSKKGSAQPAIYYADCESYVYAPVHRLYLLGYVSNQNDVPTILNVEDMAPQNVIVKWLNDMTSNAKKDVICYFHNLKYDYHVLEPYLPLRDKVVKDNAMYSVTLKYKGKTIELRDSYKLIPFALAKFGKNFNLDAKYRKKEAIAYTYYTPENNDVRVNTDEYRKLLSNEDKEIFDKNVVECMSFYHEVQRDGEATFNPLTYYKDYLRLDCLVLKYGMKKFNEIILKVTDNQLSIYQCLTISSLTDKYMLINGAYDDVFEVSGNLRAYIGKAVYGGRVAVNEKYKKKVIEGKISDYDGVSLYPSAINRLCREIGLPKGKAKRFTKRVNPFEPGVVGVSPYAGSIDVDHWRNTTYAVMTVRIKKVNKIQQMPFIAYKDTKQGSTQYLNKSPPESVIIDKFTLEDYIFFHQIEYEILDGVYWDEGGNKTMGTLIQKLFNERLKHKESNPALANTLKLMLNSSYGKTILKKSKTETKIIKIKLGDESKFNDYVYNNFHTIKKYRKINDYYYEVERTCFDDSYNRAHIGASILSYSKRIMNEVFDVANDCNYPVYYTDTDSVHLNFEHVQPLEDKYRETYNRELNGKNLEQFHIDFDLDGAKSEIYAIKSIFLGKKSYIDMLESTDADGKTIAGYHYRLKGITKEGLEHAAKQYSVDGKTPEYFALYEDLAKGTAIDIVLNPYNVEKNKTKVLFKFKDGQVSTKQKFIRKVKF